jgi:hypothetical protein
MFYYDLVVGHRALWGGEGLLSGCEHHRDAARIPLSEATRLLMNRCTGLLFARERLERQEFSPEDGDFVGRNLAKAQLAFGDAVLTVFGQYHWSCRERQRRLQHLEATKDLPWLAEVQRRHLSGVSFKLHPHRSDESRSALAEKHEELSACALQLWLWLESRRLGCRFISARDYACSRINKCPETRPWRNLALNLVTFGFAGLLGPRNSRHPRERVFNALAWLLWQRKASNEAEILQHAGKEIGAVVKNYLEAVAAYGSLWRRFS